jgi:hypothetical protein
VTSALAASLARGEDGDRVVVECDDGVLRGALMDLNFAPAGDRFERRFSRGSVSDEMFARFEACLVPLLRQAARLEPAPWADALRDTAGRLDRAGVDWWLTGSGALGVRGSPPSPRDLDLVVSDRDAARVAAAFEDVAIEPPVSVRDWFCRWWGRAWLGARVEWVGGVTAAADDPEPTDFGLVAAAALEEVRWEGYAIRVPPLDLQRAVSLRRGLHERVRMIDSMMRAT